MKADFKNLELSDITLYYSPACGFCHRVMRFLEKFSLTIAQQNIWTNHAARTELYKGGGKTQVPALKIELPDNKVYWMYESLDIIEFLQEKFVTPGN